MLQNLNTLHSGRDIPIAKNILYIAYNNQKANWLTDSLSNFTYQHLMLTADKVLVLNKGGSLYQV